MNVFGKRENGWRKGRKRGVSPIIATILLVAITVVLAAVLYVLVSGLTKTGTTTPYELSMTELTATGSGTTWVITMSLSPSAGLSTGIFGLKISGPVTVNSVAPPAACAAYASPAAKCTGVSNGWYGVLVASNNTVAASWNPSTQAWAGFANGSSSVTLNGGYTLEIISYAAITGNGDQISAYGTGTSSVSGSQYL
jgi:flagellin-like protein